MVEVVNLLFNDATEGPEFESRSGLLMIVLKKYVLFKLFLTCKIINEITRNFKSIILLLFIYGRGLDSLVADSFSVPLT